MCDVMPMTIDQKFNFLRSSFSAFDSETLFVILQANQYELNKSFEDLFEMEGVSLKPPCRVEEVNTPSHNTPTSSTLPPPSQESTRRGAKVSLPSDFLRPPHYKPPNSSLTSILPSSSEYLTLFSDPAFLAEMEREFGPGFEAVLREHIQAEALRNTAASQYSHANQSYLDQERNSDSNFQNAPASSQHQQVPPQPISENVSQPEPIPPSMPMEGFGGGDSGQSLSSKSSGSTSISDRFQSILNRFMPPSQKESKRGCQESRGLLNHYDEMSDEEGEEEDFVNPNNFGEGMEMKAPNRRQSRAEDELEEDTDLLLQK